MTRTTTTRSSDEVLVEVTSNPVCLALYVNGTRVSGHKPLGTQRLVQSFLVNKAALIEALEHERTDE